MSEENPNYKLIRLAGARVEVHDYKVVSIYDDGARCEFWPCHGDVESQRAGARYAGYGDDLMRFGLSHDLMHHWVAAKLLEHPVSSVIWAAAHDAWGLPENRGLEWPHRMRDEEHFANTTLRMITTGERTDPIGNMHTLSEDLEGYLFKATTLLSSMKLLPGQEK